VNVDIILTYDEIVAFHGHSCPGLAIGYRMTKAGLDFLAQSRSGDEELVAIVENDACGVDALQCLSGCTFGKGNLLFRDYGKQVYTLYSRATGRGVRVVFDDSKVPPGVRENRHNFVDWMLSEAGAESISLQEVFIREPERAQIRSSIKCANCGDSVMETRVRELNGRSVCIPCAESLRRAKAGKGTLIKK
jgi:formylmethanofuran dehydrogenase subunit E